MFQTFKDLLAKVDKISEKAKPLQEKVITNTLSTSKNLLSSWRKPTTQQQPPQELGSQFYKDDVDLKAGVEFIESYEANLIAIHQNHQYLYNLSDKTDKKIGPVYQAVANHSKLWTQFVTELAIVPKISSNIERLKQEIDVMCKQIENLENLLTQEIEAVANLECEIWKQKEKTNTANLREKKIKELDQKEFEERVAQAKQQQHALEMEKLRAQKEIEEQKIKAKEKERQDRLREQELMLKLAQEQAKLQEQFSRDLENYRKHGTLPKKKKKKKAGKKLEEVELENPNQDSLEQFLGPESPMVSKPQSQGESVDEEDSQQVEVIATQETVQVEELFLTTANPPASSSNTVPPEKEKDTEQTTTQEEKKDAPSTTEKVEDVDDNWMS